MSDPTSFEKRTLAPGWSEIRIIIQRPDTPDYTVTGEEARTRIAFFVLSAAAGIAHRAGALDLEVELTGLAHAMGLTNAN